MSLGALVVRTGIGSVVKTMRIARRFDTRPRGTADVPIETAVSEARRILVVALAEIGDAALLSPFLRELRRHVPGAEITLVLRPVPSSLYARCPHVDRTVAYEPRVARLLRPVVLPFRAARFARDELRDLAFDVAIMPRWDTDHHFATAVAFWSGAARRVGYSEHVNARKATLNASFDELLTDPVPNGGGLHEVERHFDLLRFVGATPTPGPLESWPTPDDEREVDEQLARAGVVPGAPLVGLLIGAADPKRRWPTDRFAQVARGLLRKFTDAHVLIVGGSEDVGAQAEVLSAAGDRVVPLAGRLTLRQSAAALHRCVAAVSNDSGALHLAAASGVACVEISCHPRNGDVLHNNAPERFGPWGVPSAILRPATSIPPCSSACEMRVPHCILRVGVDEVLAAAVEITARALRSARSEQAPAIRPIR